MAEESNDQGAEDSPQKTDDALAWVDHLSFEQLSDWLRRCFWTPLIFPVKVPPTSRFAIELSNLLRTGSAELRIRAREIIPILLQEWGSDDSGEVLDDLLLVAGRLRCASAEPIILEIINRRIRTRSDAVERRQRCLAVLSGFGVTQNSAGTFKKYINDVEYAFTCYRALYRYEIRYAASELEDIVRTFRLANASGDLDVVAVTLFRDLSSSRHFVEVLTEYLESGDREALIDMVELFRRLGIFNAGLMMQAKPSERVKLYRLLLERCPARHFQELLWRFESVGIGLYVQVKNGRDYIHVVSRDIETDSKTVDSVIEARKLNSELVGPFISGSESLAAIWAEDPQESDLVH